MKVIKKLGLAIAPHLTHLINTIISTQIYPTILQISHITPNLKPEKDPYSISSYRPLNNLSTIDKIVQEHIKLSLMEFLVNNNIIHLQHHGGLKNHSTTTALACLTHKLKQFLDENFTTTTLQTDMSTALDTVEHTILLQKLDYYGIRGGELNLIKSFLTNRKQYVEIDGIKSKTLDSLNC